MKLLNNPLHFMLPFDQWWSPFILTYDYIYLISVFDSDHWRKNLPVLAHSHRVYSIDLIGYGYSDKPNPRQFGVDYFYTFETWATQLNDFCQDIVKDEAFFICNSIGGDLLYSLSFRWIWYGNIELHVFSCGTS